jgi:hypothetical protein
MKKLNAGRDGRVFGRVMCRSAKAPGDRPVARSSAPRSVWSRRRAFRSVTARHATIEAVVLSTPYAPSINAGTRRGAHSHDCCHTKYSAARRLILLAARQATALRTRTPSLSDQVSSSWNVSLIVSPERLLRLPQGTVALGVGMRGCRRAAERQRPPVAWLRPAQLAVPAPWRRVGPRPSGSNDPQGRPRQRDLRVRPSRPAGSAASL